MMIRKLYVVLPYLTTSNPMEIRGVVFRSSRDIDFFEDEVKDTFTKIFNMFYLKDDYKIDEMAYAYFEYQNDIELKNILDDLVKIKILLSFLYSSPHPSNLSTGLKDEHAQMYLFYPMKISSTYTYEDYNVIYTGIGSPPKDTGIHDNIDGFHYSINDETDCYISMESKIYPTSRKMYLNIPQDLNNELIRLSFSENPIVSMLLTNESFFQNDNRIFTAIKWYNSTNSFSYNEDMNIIHLAIAFESLFCIPKDEKIKETLITHFRLLLGEIDHIESWVTQFYNARSSLVHEGKIIDYNYWYRNEDTRTIVPYRSLVSYGRKIFWICLEAILQGLRRSNITRVSSLFATNYSRYLNIAKEINSSTGDPKQVLTSIKKDVEDIDNFLFVKEPQIKTSLMLFCLSESIEKYLAINPKIPESLNDKLKDFITLPKDKLFEKLKLVMEMKKMIDGGARAEESFFEDYFKVIELQIHSLWHYEMNHYFEMEYENRKKEEQKEDNGS